MGILVRTVLAASLAAQASCGWSAAAWAQNDTPAPSAGVPAGRSLAHLQPDPGPDLTPYVVDPSSEPALSRFSLIAALR